MDRVVKEPPEHVVRFVLAKQGWYQLVENCGFKRAVTCHVSFYDSSKIEPLHLEGFGECNVGLLWVYCHDLGQQLYVTLGPPIHYGSDPFGLG